MPAIVVTLEEFRALVSRIDALEAMLRSRLDEEAHSARAYLTPRRVAKRHGVRLVLVYEACRSGRLVAENHALAGSPRWRITAADAQQWYDRFVRGPSNQ